MSRDPHSLVALLDRHRHCAISAELPTSIGFTVLTYFMIRGNEAADQAVESLNRFARTRQTLPSRIGAP